MFKQSAISVKSLATAGFTGTALLLAGCQTNSAPSAKLPLTELPVEQQAAYFEALTTKTLKTALAGEASYVALAEAIPSPLTVQIGSFSNEGAGIVAKDVKILFEDADQEFGLLIKEMRMWGANESAVTQIHAGEDARIADRVEWRNVSWIGFDALLSDLSNAGSDAVLDATLDALGEDDVDQDELPLEFNNEYANLSYEMDRVIVDGLVVNAPSVDLSTLGEGGDWTNILKVVAAIQRAASMDDVVATGTTMSFDFNQTIELEEAIDTSSMSMSMNMPLVGYHGLSDGNLDLYLIKDHTYSSAMTMKDASQTAPINLKQSGEVAYQTITGFQSSKLMEWFARGEMPSADEKDIFSLGEMEAWGFNTNINDKPYFGAKYLSLDMSDWTWFVPTDISLEIDDGLFGLEGYFDFFTNTLASSGEFEGEEAEIFDAVISVMRNNGLSEFKFDGKFDLNWNPDTGATILDSAGLTQGISAETTTFNAVLPTYDQFKNAFRQENESVRTQILGEAFENNFSFSELTYNIEDLGFLEKLFSAAVEIGQYLPEDTDGVDMLRNSTPESLRRSASGFVRIAAFGAAEEFPPAVNWLNAFADFVLEGGTFNISSKPDKPLTMKDFNKLDTVSNQDAADLLVNMLKLKIEHTPPEDTANK